MGVWPLFLFCLFKKYSPGSFWVDHDFMLNIDYMQRSGKRSVI